MESEEEAQVCMKRRVCEIICYIHQGAARKHFFGPCHHPPGAQTSVLPGTGRERRENILKQRGPGSQAQGSAAIGVGSCVSAAGWLLPLRRSNVSP